MERQLSALPFTNEIRSFGGQIGPDSVRVNDKLFLVYSVNKTDLLNKILLSQEKKKGIKKYLIDRRTA